MERVRKPAEQRRVERRSPESLRARKRARLFNLGLISALVGAWFVFVQALEGLDLDTTFLALFCAALSMFIIKSIFASIARRD